MVAWRIGWRVRVCALAASLLTAPVGVAGQDVSLLRDSVKLKLFANFSLLGIVSTDRPFVAGDPLFLLPESPFGFKTNTFDLHARQTNFGFVFQGPKLKGLNTGAVLLAFIQNENLVADAYGLLPFLAFGELRNDKWRFAAGLNLDVFSPLYPNVLPLDILYASGNVGTYRGQLRFERYFAASAERHYTVQFGVGDPVGSIIIASGDFLEDNGWPNLELRLAAGLGTEEQRLGERKLRPATVGLSGVIGQLRTTGIITSPSQLEDPNRRVVNVHGLGLDLQLAFNKRVGLTGELYVGAGLGDYSGGILQSFNNITFEVINSQGVWGEAYWYFNDRVHLHAGYGMDDPQNDDLSPVQILHNQTAYGTFFWDLSRVLQLGFEVDWRATKYFAPLRDADGWLFMGQVLWRL